MFNKKRKGSIRTFVNGEEVKEDQVPEQIPDLEVPEVLPEPKFTGECLVCYDFGFYADNIGVWHHCPRCNPKKEEEPTKKGGKK